MEAAAGPADGVLDHCRDEGQSCSAPLNSAVIADPAAAAGSQLIADDVQTYLSGFFCVVVVVYLQEQYQFAKMSSINITHYSSTWS